MNAKPLHIAIDGPVASGKGAIAAALAQKFHLLYIYTGAMYRALALSCLRAGIPFTDEVKILVLLRTLTFEFVPPKPGSDYAIELLLNGESVTERITHQDTAQGASDVGSIASVRQWMVAKQQALAIGKNVVMEGRDIGLRVLPDAQLKIYLTASVEERAKRRFAQWQHKKIAKTFEETLADTKFRDAQDMTRSADPLQKVPDAWELDTTGKTIDQVVDTISQELQKRSLV